MRRHLLASAPGAPTVDLPVGPEGTTAGSRPGQQLVVRLALREPAVGLLVS
jgi:hypothetical protein